MGPLHKKFSYRTHRLATIHNVTDRQTDDDDDDRCNTVPIA